MQARRARGRGSLSAAVAAAAAATTAAAPPSSLFRAGGDFVKGDGTGRACLWGDRFADEPAGLRARHAGPGLLAMANGAVEPNGG